MRIQLGVLALCALLTGDQPGGLRIVVIQGEDAVNIVQQKTAVAPLIEVRDRNNLPVAGATVTFSVGQGATFGGASTLTVATNAAGQAVATGLTPTVAGTIQVQATAVFQGQTAAAVISQTNVMTAAQAAAAAGGATGSAGGSTSTGGAGSGASGSSAGSTGGLFGGIALAVAGGVAGSAVKPIDQDSQDNCDFDFADRNALGFGFPASGGSFSFGVLVNCDWVATSSAPWLTLDATAGRAGGRHVVLTVSFRVDPNPGPNRSVEIRVTPVKNDKGVILGTSQQAAARVWRGATEVTANFGAVASDCRSSSNPSQFVLSLASNGNTGITGELSASGCAGSMYTQYVIEAGSVRGNTIVASFQSAAGNSLGRISLEGSISADNRTVTGVLTWHGPEGSATTPITLRVQ